MSRQAVEREQVQSKIAAPVEQSKGKAMKFERHDAAGKSLGQRLMPKPKMKQGEDMERHNPELDARKAKFYAKRDGDGEKMSKMAAGNPKKSSDKPGVKF